jgi:pyrroline-5-carboxylate reductase
MAEAMIAGMVKSSFAPSQISFFDINVSRQELIQGKYNIGLSASPVELAAESDIIMLAVKPQQTSALLREIQPVVGDSLLLSIAAGVTLEQLSDDFGSERVVRGMPNTPAMVGHGMTAWAARSAVTDEQREQSRLILQSFGEEMFVDDEQHLDMATAISASGVAYYYLMMEAMVDAGVHLGCNREMSKKLVLNTMLGSVTYAMQSDDRHIATLKNDITSPGGTTAAALYAAERGGFRTVISDTVWAAYRRSLELGNKSSNVGPGTTSTGADPKE